MANSWRGCRREGRSRDTSGCHATAVVTLPCDATYGGVAEARVATAGRPLGGAPRFALSNGSPMAPWFETLSAERAEGGIGGRASQPGGTDVSPRILNPAQRPSRGSKFVLPRRTSPRHRR